MHRDPARPSARLAGCRVLVTRPADQAGPTVAALEQEQAEVMLVPLLRIEPAADPSALAQAARDVLAGQYDWVVVTSANGARAMTAALGSARRPVGPPGVRWCAVGPTTAGALAQAGLRVACVPERHEGAALPEALARHGPLAGSRILLSLGDLAPSHLEIELARRGATVRRVTAYRTVPDPEAARRAALAIMSGEVAVVVVASPSAVHALAVAAASLPGDPQALWRAAAFCAIGPTTAAALREAGAVRAAHAAHATPEALVDAVAELWAGRPAAPPTAPVRRPPAPPDPPGPRAPASQRRGEG